MDRVCRAQLREVRVVLIVTLADPVDDGTLASSRRTRRREFERSCRAPEAPGWPTGPVSATIRPLSQHLASPVHDVDLAEVADQLRGRLQIARHDVARMGAKKPLKH
jgi:hypothetical protein